MAILGWPHLSGARSAALPQDRWRSMAAAAWTVQVRLACVSVTASVRTWSELAWRLVMLGDAIAAKKSTGDAQDTLEVVDVAQLLARSVRSQHDGVHLIPPLRTNIGDRQQFLQRSAGYWSASSSAR